MRERTPQSIANWLGLYMVRQNGVWYGCRCRPVYDPERGAWLVTESGIEAVFLWHDVLYMGSDRESLHAPEKENTNGGQL